MYKISPSFPVFSMSQSKWISRQTIIKFNSILEKNPPAWEDNSSGKLIWNHYINTREQVCHIQTSCLWVLSSLSYMKAGSLTDSCGIGTEQWSSLFELYKSGSGCSCLTLTILIDFSIVTLHPNINTQTTDPDEWHITQEVQKWIGKQFFIKKAISLEIYSIEFNGIYF